MLCVLLIQIELQRLAEQKYTQLLIRTCTDAYYKDDIISELADSTTEVSEFYTKRISHTNHQHTCGLPTFLVISHRLFSRMVFSVLLPLSLTDHLQFLYGCLPDTSGCLYVSS